MKKNKIKSLVVLMIVIVFAFTMTACDMNGKDNDNDYTEIDANYDVIIQVEHVESNPNIAPLIGATVKLDGTEKVTDEQGLVHFQDVKTGDYSLEIEKDGYDPFVDMVYVDGDITVDKPLLIKEGQVVVFSNYQDFKERKAEYVDEELLEPLKQAESGNTIVVGSGEYRASEERDDDGNDYFIEDSNIVIKSAVEHKAVIKGTINIEADDVTVQGLKINPIKNNDVTFGIFVDQSDEGGFDNITLRKNHISGANYGIYFGNKSFGDSSIVGGHGGSAIIEGNVIEDIEENDHGGYAIFVHTHGDDIVDNVTVSYNVITDCEKGIKIFACDESTINEVIVNDNTVEDQKEEGGHAIRVQAAGSRNFDPAGRIDEVIVSNNTVTNESYTGSGNGIRVHSGYDTRGIGKVEIMNNEVYYPGCHGIRVQIHGDNSKEEGVTVDGNLVVGNEFTSTGIRVDGADNDMTLENVIIENNRVEEIGEDGDGIGIRVQAGGYYGHTKIKNAYVSNNTVINAARESIRVHAGGSRGRDPKGSSIDTATVANNTVTGNGLIGIRVSSGGFEGTYIEEAVIEGNDIEGHKVGIWNRACGDGDDGGGEISSLTIKENEIKDCTDYGILIDEGSWECFSGSTKPGGTIDNIEISNNDIFENAIQLKDFTKEIDLNAVLGNNNFMPESEVDDEDEEYNKIVPLD